MFSEEMLQLSIILEKVESYICFNENINRLRNIEPIFDRESLDLELSKVEEALSSIYKLGKLDFSECDFEPISHRIRFTTTLSPKEFLCLLTLLSNTKNSIDYYTKTKTLLEIPNLNKIFELLSYNIDIVKEIQRVIDYDGTIFDNATLRLSQIRRELIKASTDLDRMYQEIIRDKSDVLSEAVISLRDGHRVLHLKTTHRSKMKGIIFGQSSTGQTLYIEPFECVEIENKIALLAQQEQEEIEEILSNLSSYVHGYKDEIITNYQSLLELDFVFSKAMYAKEIEATRAKYSKDINLIDARHPLIDQDRVVANTITLKKGQTMIITGANTGGKTVVLKTCGLLSLMNQIGLLIPASEGSTLPIFNAIYTDIGDDQSITNNLSTFSSHIKNISKIVDSLKENSLLLLDELGSGTDPKEGVSLAIAILTYLNELDCYTLTTTHFSDLKAYSYTKDNVINASVEFDEETMKPTYHLIYGTMGSSNALLISKSLGLNEKILTLANEFYKEIESDTLYSFKELEASLNDRIKEIDSKEIYLKETIKKKEDELKDKESKLSSKIDEINAKKEEIISDAYRQSMNMIDEIKKLKKDLELGKEIKFDEINSISQKVSNTFTQDKIKKTEDNRVLKVGDYVFVSAYNGVGKIEEIKKNRYFVILSGLNLTLKRSDLEYYEKEVKKDNKQINKDTLTNLNVSQCLDLRGMRYDEAHDALDHFVSSCLQSSYKDIHIIHGYGTLALKNMVVEYCKTSKYVESYRSGNSFEGGSGSTIITLK